MGGVFSALPAEPTRTAARPPAGGAYAAEGRVLKTLEKIGTNTAGRQLGRARAGQIVTVDVTDHELHVTVDGSIKTFPRTTSKPARWTKAHRPHQRHAAEGAP